ncbi:hypothetical protein PWT90_07204 [Aphanocladium album]|nr:hypothetical protein PWT90_07204 [Aphanocladium album]
MESLYGTRYTTLAEAEQAIDAKGKEIGTNIPTSKARDSVIKSAEQGLAAADIHAQLQADGTDGVNLITKRDIRNLVAKHRWEEFVAGLPMPNALRWKD